MDGCLWYVSSDDSTGKLVSAYARAADGNESNAILAAQPFTVSLKTVMVPANHHHTIFESLLQQDGILILSSNSIGAKPEVQRVHYYQDQLPADTALNDFLADTVYVCDDYSGNERLWLEFHVVGVGIPPEERDALLSKFTSLAETAGAIFPVTLPYSFIAENIAGAVGKLIDAVQQPKQLLDRRVSFFPHHPRDSDKPFAPEDRNTPILRQGRFVVFASEVDASAYVLQDDYTLSPNPNIPYVVFCIDQEYASSPDWVVSQRVAMLLTHLKEGNPNAEQAPIEFLKDTLTGYSNFDNLKRYHELLAKKQQNASSLSSAEQALMDRIASIPDLKPFLLTSA